MAMTMATPKYDFRTNPPYQIDFTTSTKGRRLSLTKRCISFRFGFSNAEAIAEGQTGVGCRGEEHEVKLTWSLTSGKRSVMFNGREKHFSTGKITDLKFDCDFQINGDHTIKLVAHATPAVLSPSNEFRQFELFLDGLSFFDMPKMFELGAKFEKAPKSTNEQVTAATTTYDYAAPRVSGSEFSFAHDNYQYSTPSKSYDTTSTPNYLQAQSEMIDAYSTPVSAAPCPGHSDTPSFAQPAVTTPSFLPPSNIPMSNIPTDEFAPVCPPPPTFENITNQIMNSYENPQPNSGILAIENGPEREFYQPVESPSFSQLNNSFTSMPDNTQPQESSASSVATPVHNDEKLTMHSLQGRANDSPQSIRQLDELERAMQNLVNFDHMCESPIKLTMMEEEGPKKPSNKSQAIPPVKAAWHLGDKASLADIKATASPREAPTKEVMRPNAFNSASSQAGMMVVHGSQATNYQVPPIQHSFAYNAYGGAY